MASQVSGIIGLSDFVWLFSFVFFESSPAWPGTPHVDQASLELVTIPLLLPTAGDAGLSPYPALVGSLSKPFFLDTGDSLFPAS